MIKLFNSNVFQHVLVAGVAMFYTWLIYKSPYVKTGLQFVGPLFVMLIAHACLHYFKVGFSTNFSKTIYLKTLFSITGTAAFVVILGLIPPDPAQANSFSEIFRGPGVILLCIAMIFIPILCILAVGFLFMKIASYFFKRSHKPSDHDIKFFELGNSCLSILIIFSLSLEGLPDTYSFDPRQISTAEIMVDSPKEKVWKAMETATSPSFSLPKILQVFPQPVEVTEDQGIELNAMRVVKISGREGVGFLTLKVIDRTKNQVTFKVLSDTSPFGSWIKHHHLTYQTVQLDGKTRLQVSLHHERLLSPAWFFGPAMKLASYLAMDVLARDVKERSEY